MSACVHGSANEPGIVSAKPWFCVNTALRIEYRPLALSETDRRVIRTLIKMTGAGSTLVLRIGNAPRLPSGLDGGWTLTVLENGEIHTRQSVALIIDGSDVVKLDAGVAYLAYDSRVSAWIGEDDPR